jgi:hypothetical protein
MFSSLGKSTCIQFNFPNSSGLFCLVADLYLGYVLMYRTVTFFIVNYNYKLLTSGPECDVSDSLCDDAKRRAR